MSIEANWAGFTIMVLMLFSNSMNIAMWGKEKNVDKYGGKAYVVATLIAWVIYYKAGLFRIEFL